MPRPRSTLVSLEANPYYHCTSHCVRRAFLCGEDRHIGHSFEHREQWIENRMLILAGIHSIDIAAYVVMCSHYHVVLHVNREQVLAWSDTEFINRWHRLFKGSLLSQRFCRGESLVRAEQHALAEQVVEWRQRLVSISWFLRCLNEPIDREAYRKDDVTGRFWEGRHHRKLCWMKRPWLPAWCMSISIRSESKRRQHQKYPFTPRYSTASLKHDTYSYQMIRISKRSSYYHSLAIHTRICPLACASGSPIISNWSTGVDTSCVKTRKEFFPRK